MNFDNLLGQICWECAIQGALVFGVLYFPQTQGLLSTPLAIAIFVVVAGMLSKPIAKSIMPA